VIRQHGQLSALIVSMAIICGGEKLLNADEKAPFAPSLVMVDDTVIPAPSLTIVDGRVIGDGVPADLTLDDLKQIVTHGRDTHYLDNDLSLDKPIIIHLPSGGRLLAKSATIADDRINIQWRPEPPLDLRLDLPLDIIRGLEIVSVPGETEYEKSLATPSATLDRVLIETTAGQISSITGVVESLDVENITLDVNGQKRDLPRSKLAGIVFAQPVRVQAMPRFSIKFRDYSELSGDTLTVAEGKGTLAIAPKAEARFDWSSVYETSIRSSRLAYLSDFPTLNEEQTPIVTPPFPAKRDKSVSGGRLRVGLIEHFDKGLGVHARSAITFAINGKWDIFKAKIGLDDEAEGKGDCIFRVLADGKSIFHERKTGQDLGTTELKVPITGCQELTLLVEPGEGLDMADHANWCDARLIKNKEP